MLHNDSDELARLTREICDQFGNDNVGLLFVDFSNSTRGTAFRSFWDMTESEVLPTAREFVECLNSPMLPIRETPTTEDET